MTADELEAVVRRSLTACVAATLTHGRPPTAVMNRAVGEIMAAAFAHSYADTDETTAARRSELRAAVRRGRNARAAGVRQQRARAVSCETANTFDGNGRPLEV